MANAKYKPLGIKEDTYAKLLKKKNELSNQKGKPVSFDETISELLKNG